MLTLHHLEYSQSFRILWLLEELGAEYDLIVYQRDCKSSLAPDSLKTLSPLGTAPVITDGEIVMAESNAIIDYLLDQYPESDLRPVAGDLDRTQYLFWLHTSQGTMMTFMTMDTVFQAVVKRVPWLIRGLIKEVFKQVTLRLIKPRLQKLLQRAELDLGNKPWFGGKKLSAADIAMSYAMESAKYRGYITDEYPHCHSWFKRMHESPSFVSAKKKDGKESMVLPL